MSNWSPVWRVTVDGVETTSFTLATLTITSGRSDIYSQPNAGYCRVQLANYDQTVYPFDIGTSIAIEVKDSTNTFIPIFGGTITDYGISVDKVGSVSYSTLISITALGAISRLQKITDTTALATDYDGNQIYTLLSSYLLGQWNEVPAATTWATYTPATDTWTNAVNIGLGEIDTGTYEMIATNGDPVNLYTAVTQIATSGFGYIYEDSNGNIGYADATHRQDYLSANGYVALDANEASAKTLSILTKSGDVRNKITLNYGNNGTSTYTAEDTQSQGLYGLKESTFTSSIKHTADATAEADRLIDLRAFPYPQFQSITYNLESPELSDTDRDALIGVFLGLPVDIQNLPLNMINGSFQGFVEGWTFQAGYNKLSLTFNASPVSFSLTANKWENVIASEQWNTLSSTMDWLNATVVA